MSFKKMTFLCRLLFSFILLWFAIRRAGTEIIFETIDKMDVVWFVQMLSLLMFFDIVPAIRLSYSLFGRIKIVRILTVYAINLKTFSLSLVLPGDIAGYVIRVVMLRRQVDIKKAAATVFLDKLMFIVVSSIVGILLSIILVEYTFLAKYFAIIAFSVILLMHLSLRRLWLYVYNIAFVAKYKTSLEELRTGCMKLINVKFASVSVVVSLTGFFLMSWWIKLIALHFGISVSQPVLLLFACTLTIVQLLPVSVGGIGLRESTAVTFLGIVGIMPDAAISIGVAISVFAVARAFVGAMVFGISAMFVKEQDENSSC